MKTNHNRNFVGKRASKKNGQAFNKASTFSDVSVGASVPWDIVSRTTAQAVRGAKKYVNSRTRFHDKAALNKMIKQGNNVSI